MMRPPTTRPSLPMTLGTALFLAFGPAGVGSAAGQAPRSAAAATALDSLLNVHVQAASRYEQEARWAPASITIVTGETIRSRGYATLADVLNDVPGFYTTYDRDYTYVGVRGFSRPTDWNNRVLILLNGHRLNEGLYLSIPAGSELEQTLYGVERIEIIRGPGSAMYGTSAMFAVINLVTRSGEDLAGGHLSVELGSFGARTVSFAVGERLANGVDFSLSGETGHVDGGDLYFPEFDDPLTNSGVASGLDWADFEKVTATLSYQGFGLTARFGSRDKGIPTAAWGTAFNDSGSFVEGRWGGVELRYERRLSPRTHLTANAAFDGYRFHGVYPGAGDPFENASDVRGVGGGAQFIWDISSAYRATLGAEATHYLRADYRDRVGEVVYYDEDFPYTVGSLYGQVEAHLAPGYALTAGLRHDEYTFAGTSTTPRLAFIAAPRRDTVLKLLWGRAFRAPNIYEQFVVNARRGRPELRPETVETWELTGEQQLGGHWMVLASAYHSQVADLIDQEDSPDGSTSWFTNLGRASTVGTEIGMEYRTDRVVGSLSYGHAAASDAATGDPMNNSPRHIANGSLSLRLPLGTKITWTQRIESGRLTVSGSNTRAHAVSGLTLRKESLLGGVGALFQVRNLFDTGYSTPAGFEHRQATIPQDGRSFTLRVEWHP